MRPLAIFLALTLCLPAAGQPIDDTITIAAPRPQEQTTLKTAQTAGTAVAAGGAGLMAYAIFLAPTGPIGWAAGLIFMGGMTAYLSHRRMAGEKDFEPYEPGNHPSRDHP